MAIAATGAGLHVAADYLQQTAAQPAGEAGTAANHVDAVSAVLAVVLPVAVYTLALFVIHSWLVGELDRFHLLLVAGAAVFLILPALLAVGGVALPECLLVLVLAPVVIIVGYERVGHAHQAEVIQRLQSWAGHRASSSGGKLPGPRR